MNQIFVKVHGNVQGVFFRAYTRDKANELGLKGWVRNAADGTVEVFLQGNQNKTDEMLEWLKEEGSPGSSVEKIEKTKKSPAGEEQLSEFTIRY